MVTKIIVNIKDKKSVVVLDFLKIRLVAGDFVDSSLFAGDELPDDLPALRFYDSFVVKKVTISHEYYLGGRPQIIQNVLLQGTLSTQD